ncbi:MAG: hypothetical protein HY904_08945 [Deltaproteobacteria bacterium]|nr:hypothetical protein [Deltaproteobacteria bacterium]
MRTPHRLPSTPFNAWRHVATVVLAVCLAPLPTRASLSGECRADLRIGSTSYALASTETLAIPTEGDIHWVVARPTAGPRRGVATIVLPSPLGEIALRTWGDDGKPLPTRSQGSYHYFFSGFAGGVRAPVRITETAPDGTTCGATATVELEGSSPLAWAFLFLGALALRNVWLAMHSRRPPGGRHRGDVVGGWASGLVCGLVVALGLALLGVCALDNPLLLALPIGGLVGGLGLALWAPLGRKPANPPPDPAP